MEVGWRLGKVLDDRYKIESVVGIGGMAVVYKAYDQRLMRDVALKVLRDDVAMDAESRKQFRNEYEAVAKLSHPNIRAVYDVVASGDTEYIVMEYVDGVNLKQYLKKAGALPWEQVLDFSIQITRALSHAHSRGIIHLDIKPQNIMLPKDGSVKIADFGIAQMEENSDEESADEAVGSIHYISPEQARGEAVDARSDIYSLGVVMYEMLTGKLPFDGETVEQVAVQHYSVIPDAPCQLDPSIPPELEGITLRAMEPELDDRYATADEMLSDLEDFQQSLTQTAEEEQAAEEELLLEENDESLEEAAPAMPVPGPGKVPVRIVKDEVHIVRKNVPRISRSGELSREGYVRRRSRANAISTLLGFSLVTLFALGLFVFVWNYWLDDIFRDAERVEIPAFVGYDVDDITSNEAMTELFKFKVIYQSDPTYHMGVIMDQDPASGSSRMVASDGIEVTLTVSSGLQLIRLPLDLVNSPFTDAQVRLTSMGMNVIIAQQQSDSITANYVISTDPAPGEAVVSGSTVTIYVSAGPRVTYSTVPDLLGQTKASALLALQREGLICTEEEITYVSSAVEDTGRVTYQNYAAGTEVVGGTRVYLTIGSGPIAAEVEDQPIQATITSAPPPAAN